MRTTENTKPPTSKQSHIKAISSNKQRSADAHKAERERQKRSKSLKTL